MFLVVARSKSIILNLQLVTQRSADILAACARAAKEHQPDRGHGGPGGLQHDGVQH